MKNTTQNNLLTLRARGMTQSAIARLTGIPQPRLSRWETGGAPQTAEDALRIAALASEPHIKNDGEE